MSTHIKIGLTITDSEIKHHYYVRWLTGADEIEVVPLSAEKNNAEALQQCDALVLSGGIDISPSYYNKEEWQYPLAPVPFNEKRDAFEVTVFRQALENDLPVLGICRGLQLVNCVLGGNLKQDLGPLNEVHRAKGKDKVHEVEVLPGTLLHEICTDRNQWVNSAHHQAIDRLGKGLKVNCIADDGVIEGIEWEDSNRKPFLLCVQWHPERMGERLQPGLPLSDALRNRFMKEISQSKKQKYENH